MGEVQVSIHHQTYRLACRDGDEERLQRLAQRIDESARDLADRLGQVGETRLMLMVALLFADELDEAQSAGSGGGEASAGEAARLLDEASSQIEGIVARLSQA